jgi:hypothetical protein
MHELSSFVRLETARLEGHRVGESADILVSEIRMCARFGNLQPRA